MTRSATRPRSASAATIEALFEPVAASAGVNPVSATYSARISSRRASSSRAAPARMACRRAGGSGRCAAATAPVTARPTSAGPAWATAANGCRVYLSSTSSPVRAGSH